MPWPPSANYLLNRAPPPPPPDCLKDFLSKVINCKTYSNLSSKKEKVATSIAEDICYAKTNGQWKTNKHFLLVITLHHLSGSTQLISIMNRFGHCQSYDHTLELETAMADLVIFEDNLLPSNISLSQNRVCHFCFDNFDMVEETSSGAGTTHSTHGINPHNHTGNRHKHGCSRRNGYVHSQE